MTTDDKPQDTGASLRDRAGGPSDLSQSTLSRPRALIPSASWLNDNLTRQEASAFLALFGGARSRLTAFRHEGGEERPVNFGKAECEWVPFRETWQERFPALGLTTFTESDPRPALGMSAGWFFTEIQIGVTDFGHAVREAFWKRVDDASAIEARSDATPKSDAAEGESAVPKGDAHD